MNSFLIFLLFLIAWKMPDRISLIAAFLIGLTIDLLSGITLGFSSFIFIVGTFLVLLYRRKFSFSHPLILLIFFILFDSLLQFTIAGKIIFWQVILFSVIIQLINLFFYQPEIRL